MNNIKLFYKTLFLLSIFVFPFFASADVLYSQANIDEIRDMGVTNGRLYYLPSSRGSSWWGSENFSSFYTTLATTTTMRVKISSGYTCESLGSTPNGRTPYVLYISGSNGNNFFAGIGTTNGVYCDLTFEKPIPPNTALNFLGRVGAVADGLFLYGSNDNAGYSYDANGANPMIGGLAFALCSDNDCGASLSSITPIASSRLLFSQIQNASVGWLNFRETPGTQNKSSYDIIKKIPNDWVLKVATTTDAMNNPIELDGYQWYGVIDITDGAVGWMASRDLNAGTIYLPYNSSPLVQTELEAKASTTLYSTKETRIPVILQAVDNYYAQTNATSSLYGGGGGVGGANNFQSFIQGSAFPKELVLAIAGHESAGKLDNDIVTFDYGHGIMQPTFQASTTNALMNKWDNRGIGSDVTLPLCKSILSDDYKKCYANSDTVNYLPKPYQSFGGNPASTTYKQYANTYQSIFSNIKDGFRTLQEKYRTKCPDASLTVGALIYTCQDVERVLMTWGYNGKVLTGRYLKDISNALRDLSAYFPGVTYINDDQLIEKLALANANRIEFKKFSPVEIEVVDSLGRVTGFDGTPIIREEIPFSRYDRDADGGVIFFPQNPYRYRVIGTGSGVYAFRVEFTQNDVLRTFYATNIPVVTGEIHEYLIDWDALDRGERGVTVQVDTNGDGVTDRIVHSDSMLTEIEQPVVAIVSPTGDHLLNSQAQIQFTATDTLSGIATTSVKLNGVPVVDEQFVTLTQAGTNTLEVTATDNEGNTATTTSVFQVNYVMSGFLPPIKIDGTGVYNQGRTLPVKFTLTDATNAPASQAIAQLYVAKISNNMIGSDEIPLSTSAADVGNQFRYDTAEKLYIFNLATDIMTPGTCQVKAVLDSGQVAVAIVSIK